MHDCYDFACILVVDPESCCLCICLLVFVPCPSSSVFYSCFLIYPSSISSDMGNKGVNSKDPLVCMTSMILFVSRSDPCGSRIMLSMYLSFDFCFVVCLFVFVLSSGSEGASLMKTQPSVASGA